MENILASVGLGLIALILLSAAISLLWQSTFGVPFLPSSTVKFKKVLTQLRLTDGAGKTFVDLGSGDGRIVLAAAKLGYKAFGVETNPFLLLISKVAAKIFKLSANFSGTNFFDLNLEDYDVVYVYLLPKTLANLEKIIDPTASKPQRIISKTFKFPNLIAAQKLEDDYYIYTFPQPNAT
jgi:SAM-dependent methyltransferase